MRPTHPLYRGHAVLLLLVIVAWMLAGCSGSASTQPRGSSSGPTPPPAAFAGTTYVALGASDAYGIGTDDPDRLNWPSVLAGELGTPAHLVNLAIPGATVSEAQQAELPVALDAHPALVTIWLAVNDLADGVDLKTYSQQLTTLVDALRRGTQAQIYVGNLPDLTLVPYFSSADPVALRAQVQAWNSAIARICAAEGAHLVDLLVGWKDLGNHPEYISSDGLHPSTQGAARIADAFAAAMRPAGTP